MLASDRGLLGGCREPGKLFTLVNVTVAVIAKNADLPYCKSLPLFVSQ